MASPLVGVFYAAPAENAAPYVAAGDHVKKGQTLCVIEAMKLMNEITAEDDGVGEDSYRIYDPDLPIGDIHQIHGSGMGEREVSFTLDPGTKASRLICGITWGNVGAWTSWPPHQHENDLEEAYCYFDRDEKTPCIGMHYSYLESGRFDDAVVHTVKDGTVVIAPYGYHPTSSTPAGRNAYFWALAAFRPTSRRYDLAVLDPAYANS